MIIIRYRRWFYVFSGILLLGSSAALIIFGLNPGIDFTGGALIEAEFLGERPPIETLRERLAGAGFAEARIQEAGERGVLARFRDVRDQEHRQILSALADSAASDTIVNEKRFDSIGPTIGAELRRKAFVAIALVLALILAFVSWAFRHAQRPMASWKYAVTAIAALAHDVLLPAGLFAVLGRVAGVEADALFVTALLTILGFSVHDTIVVFDRIRENLRKTPNDDFESVVGRSLNETFARSLATSFALFCVIAALFWFGADVTRYFALTLLAGIIFGTYSSLFLASPLLVTWQKWSERRS
ncbi:MAG: protein translocase subunit SecF [Candidatus Niyogibacteria bacterium]|nr:protein translocase subunit SecF [Candidatus Niyogibacteria bacterium]